MQIQVMSDDDRAYLLQLPGDRFSAKSYQALLITKRFRDTCTDCISCRLKNATLMEKHNESRRYCSVECQRTFYGNKLPFILLGTVSFMRPMVNVPSR